MVGAFGFYVVTPIHELGHVLSALALGIKIEKVEWWSKTVTSPLSDWRLHVVGSAGGLTAFVFLVLLYMGVRRFVTYLHSKKVPSIGRLQLIMTFSLLAETVVLTDLMLEFTFGLLEGTNLEIYHLFVGSLQTTFGSLMIFTLISLLVWTRNGALERMIENRRKMIEDRKKRGSRRADQQSFSSSSSMAPWTLSGNFCSHP